MQYKLIGNNDIYNPIDCFLENRNISKSLFNLDSSVEEDFNKYKNMQEAVELLNKHIQDNNKIEIVVDSDVDGLTSSAILYRYLIEVYNYDNIIYKLHTEKQHGLSEDITIDDDVKLVILPDSSSNDFEQHKILKYNNIDTLVLDHHICDLGYDKYSVVVNNQLDENIKNKNLSGAGVVYKFIQALDEFLFEDKSSYYLDLVALGNIADVMDLHEEETRYYVYKGIEQVNNLFIKALIENNSFDMEGKYDINKIGWVIAPKLNGTIRSGTLKEKENMFKAFISDDYDFCLNIADDCKKAKNKQDRAVKTAMNKIENDLYPEIDDKCILYKVNNKINSNHIGLIAQKISSKYGMPTLLYKENNGILTGSGRGISSVSNDFRQDLIDSNLVEFAEGHELAFGIGINKDNEYKLKEYLNKIYYNKEITNDNFYEIDFDLDCEELSEDFVNDLATLECECGNGIDFPLIHIRNVNVSLTDDNIKARIYIVFYINGIKFIKKYPTKILKDKILNKNCNLEIIGKPTIDSYSNCGQIEIVDLEVTYE